jgi:hypothetical protein
LTERATCTAGTFFLPSFLGILLREPNGLVRLPKVLFRGADVGWRDADPGLLAEGVAEDIDMDLRWGDLELDLGVVGTLDGGEVVALGFDLGWPRVDFFPMVGITTSIIIFCFRVRRRGESGLGGSSTAELSPGMLAVEALSGLATE